MHSSSARLDGKETIAVSFATNPTPFPQITYEVWVKLEEEPINFAWILSQSPDYGWPRAVTMNDDRLGGVSSTTGHGWNSELGKAPLNQWVHVVATWNHGDSSFLSCLAAAGALRGGSPEQMTKRDVICSGERCEAANERHREGGREVDRQWGASLDEARHCRSNSTAARSAAALRPKQTLFRHYLMRGHKFILVFYSYIS